MDLLIPTLNKTAEQALNEHFGRADTEDVDSALASVDEHLAALDSLASAPEDNASLLRRMKGLAPYIGAVILAVPAVPYFVHRFEHVANPTIITKTHTEQRPDPSHYGGTESVVITTQTPNYGG